MVKTSAEILEISKTENFKNSLNQNILFIRAVLDRRLQKDKMVRVFGWDSDVVEEMEKDYIKYLALTKTIKDFNLDFKVIPNLYIDEFWHNHILDTRQYYEDCKLIFGDILDHFPYYGILGEEDTKDWIENSYVCQVLWNECFGEDLYGSIDEEDGYKEYKVFYSKLSQNYKGVGASRCRTTCKPQNCP